MAIVWPCSLSVDEYVAAGRDLEFPRPECPACAVSMSFWSGYRRHIRQGGRCHSMWVPRVRCNGCEVTHALLPAFVLAGRLDVAETIGALIDEVIDGGGGVRPPAERLGIPHTTARGWVRRFCARAQELAHAFAALAVDLEGGVTTLLPTVPCHALASIRSAWRAVTAFPGWLGCGRWRFVAAVTGGRLIATNTNSPYLIVGKRRFMPPVP
jgi:transposase-like protein